MSIIPVTVPTGAIRYNTDSNKMECFNGTKWMQVSVSESAPNGGRACIGGGMTPSTSNEIQYVTIATQGNAIEFGDLTRSSGLLAGCSSAIRGLWGGDHPSAANTIDYVTIATTGNAVDFGDLTRTVYNADACGSRTRGVFMGGHNPTAQDTIDYVTYTSTGDATDFGNLSEAIWATACCSSPTRGFSCLGNNNPSPNNINTIQYITIAATGNAQDFGDSAANTGGNIYATSNNIRGIVGGGHPGTACVNIIEFFTMATLGNTQDFGDTSTEVYVAEASSSPIRGIIVGGQTTSPTHAKTNRIEYITFTTTGDTTDFGDLTTAKHTPQTVSNSNGGL